MIAPLIHWALNISIITITHILPCAMHSFDNVRLTRWNMHLRWKLAMTYRSCIFVAGEMNIKLTLLDTYFYSCLARLELTGSHTASNNTLNATTHWIAYKELPRPMVLLPLTYHFHGKDQNVEFWCLGFEPTRGRSGAACYLGSSSGIHCTTWNIDNLTY